MIKNADLVKFPCVLCPVHINRTLSPDLAAAANSLSVLVIHPPAPSEICPTKLSQLAEIVTGVAVAVGGVDVAVGTGVLVGIGVLVGRGVGVGVEPTDERDRGETQPRERAALMDEPIGPAHVRVVRC